MRMVPAALIMLTALGLFMIERLFPLRRETHRLIARLGINVVLSALTFVVAWTVVQPAAHRALHWNAEQTFGIVHLFNAPPSVRLILSFLLMDLTFYYWHLANHRVPFLWRFHNVHHIDPDLDVSSAFRFHFGEIAFSAVLSVLQVSLIGISAGAFFIYQIGVPSGGAFSPQQVAPTHPARAHAEQGYSHSADARYSSLTGASGEQFELRHHLQFFGTAFIAPLD